MSETTDPINYIQTCENMQPSSTRRIRVSTRSAATTANVVTNDPQTMIGKHFSDAFKRIIEIFQDSKLCDVTLVCKNEIKIKAHRIILSSVSDYFRAMFTNNLSESFKSDIEMTNMDGNALKALVDFIYSGTIDLNDSNIFSILNAASFLQLNSVVKIGSDYLMNNLNIFNCISIRRYSEEQSLKELKFASYKYILDNFEQIVQNDDLLTELTRNELNDLFESSYLDVTCEEVVYEALMRWMHFNKESFFQENDFTINKDSRFALEQSRSDTLANLLSKIKLPLLKASYLTKQIETNNLISSSIKCQSLMLEAVTYHLNPDKFKTSPIERTNPRKSTIGYLLAIGGNDKKVCSVHTLQSSFIEKYDFRAEKWTPINSNTKNDCSFIHNRAHCPNTINLNGSSISTSSPRRQFGVAFLDHKLYIVGGRDGPKSLSTFECYDILNDVWTTMPRMNSNRHGLQASFIDSEPILYALGGHDSWAFLNSVERYDLNSDTWMHAPAMNHSRSLFGIAGLDTNIFVVGGRDHSSSLNSTECFNPLTNKWVMCANMIKRRCSVGVTSVNGSIFAIGGHEAISSSRYECGERYDTKCDQWTMITNISRPREAIAVSNLGSAFIYIAGGYDGHKYLTDCERYDPNKNEWVKIKSLNYARAGAVLIHVPQKQFGSIQSSKKNYHHNASITNRTIVESDEFVNTSSVN